jgi:hypothetical protein
MKMNDKELNEFLEFYNNDVPNPEQEPIRFKYYVKLFQFCKGLNNGK